MIINFSYKNSVIKLVAQDNEWIGCRINNYKMFYELELLEYIKSRFIGGVALDVGANIGNHSIFFSKFIFDKTYAFETNPTNFSLLIQNKTNNNISDNKLILYQVALSDDHYKYVNNDFIGNMGRSFIVEGEGELETKKLDDFDLPKVNFIKMDVEGHELKVLKGATNLIKRDFPHIVLECNNYTDDFERLNPYMKSIEYISKKVIDNMFYYEHENISK